MIKANTPKTTDQNICFLNKLAGACKTNEGDIKMANPN